MASKADEPVEIQLDAHGRVTASAAEVERTDEAWALAIGRFIVAFANLEHWTHLFIRTFGTQLEAQAATRQWLHKRLAVMEAGILRLRLTPELQERADAAIRRFRDLTPTRNLLAHNPPAVHIYTENEDGTGAMEVRHELHDSRDPSVKTTADELETRRAEAVEVEEELMLLYGLVRKPESRRK